MKSKPKETVISLRLSIEEKNKLDQNAGNMKMTNSQYLRSLINGEQVSYIDKGQDLVAKICELYEIIKAEGLQEHELLMNGVDEICRILY